MDDDDNTQPPTRQIPGLDLICAATNYAACYHRTQSVVTRCRLLSMSRDCRPGIRYCSLGLFIIAAVVSYI